MAGNAEMRIYIFVCVYLYISTQALLYVYKESYKKSSTFAVGFCPLKGLLKNRQTKEALAEALKEPPYSLSSGVFLK